MHISLLPRAGLHAPSCPGVWDPGGSLQGLEAWSRARNGGESVVCLPEGGGRDTRGVTLASGVSRAGEECHQACWGPVLPWGTWRQLSVGQGPFSCPSEAGPSAVVLGGQCFTQLLLLFMRCPARDLSAWCTAPCLASSCRWGAALAGPDFLAAWQDQKTSGKVTEEKSHQCAGSQKH